MIRHIVVGSGVAGATAAPALAQADPAAEVLLLSAEPYPYYYRPRLWELLAGSIQEAAIYARPAAWYATQRIDLRLGAPVTALQPAEQTLTLAGGETLHYDRLLLAPGARPWVPPFSGADQTGVFTLRTLDDARAIKAYAANCRTAALIGGGLLGLETAHALATLGLQVTIIESAPYLLPRQLDQAGAEVLQAHLQASGLNLVTAAAPTAITGETKATGVALKDGRSVAADLVLISTGITPNTDLARAAGLTVSRGIVVDQYLRTSAPNIFAAGDAAEFEQCVYGLIPPAMDQARAAAANMVTDQKVVYAGTMPAATLKIVGLELTSLGEATAAGAPDEIVRYAEPAAKRYRRLVLRNNIIVGAILLNDKPNLTPLRQLITSRRDISAHKAHLAEPDFNFKALL